MRNIIIGIDGGCFESITPLLKRNLLPNFKKIIENGFSSPLEVVLPHTTIPSWPCLFSGLDIEGLGYYTFINPFEGIFNSSVWKEESIFSINDLKIFALNVPGTYPAWKINGEMITGILSPSVSCYPKELEVLLKKSWIIEGSHFSDILRAFEMKKRIFLKKMKENFNLLTYVIRVPDAISHRVLGDEKLILKHIYFGYKRIDEFLGEIFREANFDNIIIFSDHGLKYYRKIIHFPRWLEKKKLLFLNNIGGNKFTSIILRLYDFLRPLIKIQLGKKIYKKLPISKKRDVDKKNFKRLKFFDRENPQTFMQKLTSNIGAILLFGEDKKRRKTILKEIQKAKFVEDVIEFERKGFPDLIIVLKDVYAFSNEPSLFVKRRTEVFSHTNRGFFMAFGKDILPGKKNLINYQQVAPTIMKMFRKQKMTHMKASALDIFRNNNIVETT